MQTKSYLLFLLNNERFAIDVEMVIRVVDLEGIKRVPQAPDFVRGIIKVDGKVLPVTDLANKIELGETEINRKTKVIIIEMGEEDKLELGLLIDDVINVVEVEPGQIQPSPLENMGLNTNTLSGMFKYQEEFYLLINGRAAY